MKTAILTLALFATICVSCYMAYETGQIVYGFINIALVYGMGAVLVRKLKLI